MPSESETKQMLIDTIIGQKREYLQSIIRHIPEKDTSVNSHTIRQAFDYLLVHGPVNPRYKNQPAFVDSDFEEIYAGFLATSKGNHDKEGLIRLPLATKKKMLQVLNFIHNYHKEFIY